MTSLSCEPQPRAADADQRRWLLLGAALVTALLLWVFWHFISAQVRFAIRQQADWGHTLVIPLIAGYFVYLNRRRLLSTAYKTTWIGLVPIVLGGAWKYSAPNAHCWATQEAQKKRQRHLML